MERCSYSPRVIFCCTHCFLLQNGLQLLPSAASIAFAEQSGCRLNLPVEDFARIAGWSRVEVAGCLVLGARGAYKVPYGLGISNSIEDEVKN